MNHSLDEKERKMRHIAELKWESWSGTFKAIALMATLVVLILGCSGELSDSTEPAKPIEIPVITSLTGDTASWGEMQQKGTEMAVEGINRSGGVTGRDIAARFEDSQGKPQSGIAAFKQVIATSEVPITVGFPLSGVTLAAADIANRENFIILSSGSTAQAVGDAGPWVFRIMPSDEVQAQIIAEWALDLGYRKIGVLYVENAWGQGLKNNFVTSFGELGGEVVSIEATQEGDTDFRSQLAKLRDTDAEAFYFPLYQREAGLALKQARQLGLERQVFGADVYQSPELFEAGGSAVNGVLYTTFGVADNDVYRRFQKEHEDRFGQQPGNYTAYAYDAFRLAAEALERAGWPDATAEDIREALLGITDFKGATGNLSFDGSTSASGGEFQKMVVEDGKFVEWSRSTEEND